MSLTVSALSLLVATSAPATTPAADEPSPWSWCITDATGPGGKVRFYSDPFEGDTNVYIQAAFRDYVDRSYSKTKKTGGYVTRCTTVANQSAAFAGLRAAKSAKDNPPTVVTTAWRFYFE